jgi:hypothetical protein
MPLFESMGGTLWSYDPPRYSTSSYALDCGINWAPPNVCHEALIPVPQNVTVSEPLKP